MLALAGGDMDELQKDAPVGLTWLGHAEQRRYGELSVRRRLEFKAGRWLLRRLLEREGVVPAGRPLAIDVGGRPVLEGVPDVGLSLSHRCGRVVAAVADCAVGVDVELVKSRDVMALSQWVCSAPERQYLARLDAPSALQYFHQLWTIKEAAYKAGLTRCAPMNFSRIRVAPVAHSPPEAVCWSWANGWVVACAVAHREGVAALAPWADPVHESHWAVDFAAIA
ncbi:MAG: 4'-phosphopantetheinyl transferase superfamily protein [Nevskiaceae bacterium]|jgi:phosphopantetheinyl transferase|nr:4'-phosphopantetheinyl transferase superfamily protein [Nevskiaceae bacterium]